MMNMRVLTLVFTLALTGCKDTFLTLHFQTPVHSHDLYKAVNDTYLNSLYTAINARGIDPEQVELELDENDNRVIHLKVSDSLGAEQRATLQALFEEIPKARAATSWEVDMVLEPDAKEAAGLSTQERQRLNHFTQPIGLTLKLDPQLKMYASASAAERRQARLNGTEVETEMDCHFSADVSGPAPFKLLGITQLPGSPPERALLRYSRNTGYPPAEIPAHFLFKDASLRQKIERGEVRPWQETVILDANPAAGFTLSLEYARLGRHRLWLDQRPDWRMYRLSEDCENIIAFIGRPFSLFAGKGIDRLERVTTP